MSFLFGRKCEICELRKRFPKNESCCEECKKTFRKCDWCHELYSPKQLRLEFNSSKDMEICEHCKKQVDSIKLLTPKEREHLHICRYCENEYSNINTFRQHMSNRCGIIDLT